jgi:hypothetical protein
MRKLSAILFAAILGAASAASAAPETVHVTYHVQAGKLDELLEVLGRHYPAGRKAGIVLAEPHLILSGKEDGGKPVVIEVLTWRDANDPDEVAEKHPEIRKIWDGLNALVEKRGGKPGIEIDAMDLVGAAPAAAEATSR